MLQCLQDYIEQFGPLHCDDCSGDDTCTCAGRDTNWSISKLCVLLANACGEAKARREGRQ